MCIKLIDVLSSHTALIKMRIDTDLITYMCSIILPKQIVEVMSFQQKNQAFTNLSTHSRLLLTDQEGGGGGATPLTAANQYEMIEQEEEGGMKQH